MQDLGESGLPEPAETSEMTAERTVEAQDPDVKPASEHVPGDHAPSPGDDGTVKPVTTKPRKAMKVPDSVHVRVNTDNLKDYVGPAVYHKDRLYVKAPPAGVSTGLGYLGNGSGAVMPVEVTVSLSRTTFITRVLTQIIHRPCLVRETCNLPESLVRSSESPLRSR